jgi:hypothetical protein
MTFYRLDIGARARTTGRFIGRVRSQLLQALVEERLTTGLTQQRLSETLEVPRGLLNRQLAGEADLTLRSVAELAWALNREVHIELRKPEITPGQNQPAAFTTLESGQPRVFGQANASGATVRASNIGDA